MKNQLGIPAVIAAIIIACVVGGVVGTRNSDDDNTDARNAEQPSPADAASSKLSAGVLSSDSNGYGVPTYGTGGVSYHSFHCPHKFLTLETTDQQKIVSSSYLPH